MSSEQKPKTTGAMMVQSPHRPPRRSIQANFNNPEMFSPTSTAALALSTLHKFGADQANSASSNNEARTSSVSTLKGTRLFNGAPSNRPESTAIGSSDYETKGNEPPSLSDVLVPTMNHEEGTEAAKMPPSSSNFYTSEQTLPGNGHHHSCVSSQMWHPPPASHQTQSPPAPPYHQSVPPLHIASTGRAVYQHHESYHPPHYHCCHSYAEHHHPRPYYHQDHHHPPHQPWSSQQPAPPIVSSNAPHHGAPRVYTPHHGMQSSVPSGVGYANHGMYHSYPPPPPPPPPPAVPKDLEQSEKHLARVASCATSSMVTPTPKKQKTVVPLTTSSTANTPLQAPTTASSVVSKSPSLSTNSANPAPAPTSTLSTAALSAAYSRKKKSLGVLAENFIRHYQKLPVDGSTSIVVDEAAVQLGVERRRIYDVVNILEAIGLVSKKHKNTYAWLGTHPDHLTKVFGRLQASAITAYPEDAQKFLKIETNCKENQKQENSSQLLNAESTPSQQPYPPSQKSRENKSLAKLSQEFLQIFLVGYEVLSLPEASDKIQGTTTLEELIAMGMMNHHSKISTDSTGITGVSTSKPQSSFEILMEQRERKAAAARGLKTKIRRLYDIANVFLSVGLLHKVESGDSSRRPNFAWAYPWSAKQLYQLQQERGPNQQQFNATHPPLQTSHQWTNAVTPLDLRRPTGTQGGSDEQPIAAEEV